MSYANPKIDAVFDGIEARIIQELDKARFSIQIAMAWWTNESLTNKIVELANKGIQIEIIVWDDDPFFISRYPENSSIPLRIIESGVTLLSIHVSDKGKFHHKFCIVDEQILITGSFNWTYSAENRNEENIVIIKDAKIVESYLTQFFKFLPGAAFYGAPDDIPQIKFYSSKKFVEENEIVTIHWDIQNSDDSEIDFLLESEENVGNASKVIDRNTSFKIIAWKGGRKVVKNLDIKLYKDPSLELAIYTKGFASDLWMNAKSINGINAYHIFEGQPVKLKWHTENVDKLLIDGQEHDVLAGMIGVQSDASKTIIVEAYNRDRRTEQEVNIYVTPIPKFDTFKTPIPDPIEVKGDFTFESVTVPSTLELLDTPLLSKVNFPKIKDLKLSFTANRPTKIKLNSITPLTSYENFEIVPPYDAEPVISKTAYIKPSFRETWKKHLKTNKQIINHIKQLFKPNGK